jgi:hypothetical protein
MHTRVLPARKQSQLDFDQGRILESQTCPGIEHLLRSLAPNIFLARFLHQSFPPLGGHAARQRRSRAFGPFAYRAASNSCLFINHSRRLPTMPLLGHLDRLRFDLQAARKGDRDYAEVSSAHSCHRSSGGVDFRSRNISPQATCKKGKRERKTEKVNSFLTGSAAKTASTARPHSGAGLPKGPRIHAHSAVS